MFDKKLKAALDALGITQAKMSQLTGIGKSAISQYLSGKNIPSESRRRDIAIALGLQEDYFEQLLPEVKQVGGYKNLPPQIAANLMGKSLPFVYKGLQEGVFPWGYTRSGINGIDGSIYCRKTSDNIHPSEKGLARMANIAAEELEQLFRYEI